MAKLHFKYASMNSGKSIDLMRSAYNYEELGFKPLVIKHKVDTKGSDFIESRVGLRRRADIILDFDESVIDALKGISYSFDSVFVDEAQFLSASQVDELFIISKAFDVPVLCYGLRTNFMMESFEGSRRLLEIADELSEIKTLCSCGEVARFTARMLDGEYETSGDTVVIDGKSDYEYVPLCGKCYLEKVKKIDFKKYY